MDKAAQPDPHLIEETFYRFLSGINNRIEKYIYIALHTLVNISCVYLLFGTFTF